MIARLCMVALALVVALSAAPAQAWTRPGHMVTAAIAWNDIIARRPDLAPALGALLSAHPDRGPFQVAIDRTTGEEQARRLFLECARWADDVRGTPFDQPSWHAILTPLAGGEAKGVAAEAFALAYATLASKSADAGERAKALCWMMHIAGDLHQPLHVSEYRSAAFPDGDAAGGKRFVIDPIGGGPLSLHWLWDDAVLRSGSVADVDAKAAILVQTWPRAAFGAPSIEGATFVGIVSKESMALAKDLALREDVQASSDRNSPAPVPVDYWAEVRTASERRVALAGYRIADLVLAALGK